MAVINNIPGLEVIVEIHSTKAKEYDNPAGNDKHTTTNDDYDMVDPGLPRPHVVKYIEAIPGANFNLRVIRAANFKHVGPNVFFEAYVDGNPCDYCYSDENCDKNSKWVAVFKDFGSTILEDGQQQVHRMKFATLQVEEIADTTPEELKEQTRHVQKLGKLEILCFHGAGSIPDTSDTSVKVAPPHIPRISEEALKGEALDCFTEFDQVPHSVELLDTMNLYHDPQRRPFARFEFIYRSMEGLISEGIVARPIISTAADMDETTPRRAIQNPIKNEDTVKVGGGGFKRAQSTASSRNYKVRRLENGSLEVDLAGGD